MSSDLLLLLTPLRQAINYRNIDWKGSLEAQASKSS